LSRYIGIFLSIIVLNIVLFFALGAAGMLDYIDGIVMSVGILLTLQLAVVICLLIYLIDQLKRKG